MAAKPQYGWEHQQHRADWQREIDNHPVRCHCNGTCRHHTGRCRTIIKPGTPWHLGHRIPVAHGGADGPSEPWCAPCNLRDGQRIGEQLKATPKHSRDWDGGP